MSVLKRKKKDTASSKMVFTVRNDGETKPLAQYFQYKYLRHQNLYANWRDIIGWL